MPFVIESMFPKRAFVIVSHMFAFAVDAFEGMVAWFSLSSFEPGGIELGVGLTASHHISMMLQLVRSIALLTF